MAAKKKTDGIRTLKTVLNSFSYVFLIFGIALFLSTVIVLVGNDAFAFAKSGETVTVTLEDSQSVSEVADTLKDMGVINYKWSFKLFASLKNKNTFPAGTYEVNASMDYAKLISKLSGVKSKILEEIDVTIPEGFTMAQIAELLETKGVCKKDDFIKTANTHEFSYWMLEDVPLIENRLEGYLFPDTYRFYVGDNPERVINKMLSNFDKRFTSSMRELVEKSDYSVPEIVIIASLVEKEAKQATERATIAGVIYNRLKNPNFPNLQVDATIMYEIGHKDVLTAEDLLIDSPYNTYIREGLTPTAICNPGLASILSAVIPESNPYYFYVANPLTNYHIFSKTISEHEQAKAYVQSLLDQ